MTVQELINELNDIGDKNLDVKIENPNGLSNLDICYVSRSPYEVIINLFT